jgi:hypothetical protein
VDTMEDMLSILLNGAVEVLDVSPELQGVAVGNYEEVGSWLASNCDFRIRVYPQGSFRLGTVVRPVGGHGEYDIDLVCVLDIAKESISQAALKEYVGSLLFAYKEWKRQEGHGDGPKGCEPRRRCWTLTYPDLGFHLDVLPTIPDHEHPPSGILLTDKKLVRWQHSNPIGYAHWFRTRSVEMQRRLAEAAMKHHVDVAEVPEWTVRTALQRVVQVLKWHTMMRFERDLDSRPPSILITTLAAMAYRGQNDLFAATREVLSDMPNHIEMRAGRWWVENPAHKHENFADKWNEYPERREAFYAWHRDITAALDELAQLEGKGLHVVAARMSEAFSAGPVDLSVQQYGERMRMRTETGALHMSSTGLLTTSSVGPTLRSHTFYGTTTDPGD